MLFEREAILDRLRNRFDRVGEIGGQIVLVCGEAGIGKTSVIDALLAQLPAAQQTAVGLCDPLYTPRPLGPVRDICHALFGAAPNGSEEASYFEGFIKRASALRSTAVLVIEDMHWADQRSLDWLNYLGRRISQLPILLVGSYREDEVAAAHPLRTALGAIPATSKFQISLPPLSADAIREIAAGSGFSAEKLVEITGGNPFFITEILNNKQATEEVPASVADAVNARLNGLPQAVRDMLELASCCPGEIALDLMQAATDGAVTEMSFEAIPRSMLVGSGRRFKFRHELARLATYERQSPFARAKAHGKLLSALLQKVEPPLDMVVHHAQGADDPKILLKYAPRAAAQAVSLGAHREAAMYLAATLHYVDQAEPETAAEIYESWAHEAGLSLNIDDDVIAAREKAVALWTQLDRPQRVGENLGWLSRMHWYRGEAEIAQQYLKKAIAVLENQSPSSAKARAFALRAQFMMLQDNMDEAILRGREALAIAEEVGDQEIRAHALNTVGSAALFRGDPDGEADLRESLRIARQQGLHIDAARAFTNLSECLIELGALQRADALIEEGIDFDTRHDLDAWTFYLIGRKAQLRFEQDKYSEALAIANGVLERENLTLLMQMPALIIRARAKLRLSESDAQESLDTALAGAERIGEPQYLLPLYIARIEAAVLANNPAQATPHIDWIESLDPGLISPRKQGEILFWCVLADHDHAGEIGAGASDGFVAFAARDFERAAVHFGVSGARYFAAWAHVMKGGKEAFASADQVFREIDAIAARKSLRLRAPDLAGTADLPPLRRGKYRAARQHPYELTGKEQVVLRHLALGASNEAIARKMSRSRRTVENHVSSILSKMRAENRMEVVLRTQSEPWILTGE